MKGATMSGQTKEPSMPPQNPYQGKIAPGESTKPTVLPTVGVDVGTPSAPPPATVPPMGNPAAK
jgi:hypothetical protein